MGNIDAKRDWGHAKDYVRMQWLMLQQDKPDDYVIASGEQFSVKEFITWAANDLGFGIKFEGVGVDTIGIVSSINDDKKSELRLNIGDIIVRIDPRYFRPAEVETLLGDPSKAKSVLGWEPEISAREMCEEMVRDDLAKAKDKLILIENKN
jgi:GDPmannose 4,6-dehydratase